MFQRLPVRPPLAAALVCAVVLGVAAPCAPGEPEAFWGDEENWAAIAADGLAGGSELIPFTELGARFDLSKAYRIQLAAFALAYGTEDGAGYKAGLTNRVSRYRFRAREPIAGILPAGGLLAPGAEVLLAPGMLVEAELGFRLRRPIEAPISGTTRLVELIETVHPVVEIPRVPFARDAELRPADIVAVNSGAHAFLVGPAIGLRQPEEINGVFVELLVDDAIVSRGKAMNVEPDQLETLRWLVNRYVDLGRRIVPEDLLLTGSMTPIRPLEPGRYEVRYRGLSSIEFVVRAR